MRLSIYSLDEAIEIIDKIEKQFKKELKYVNVDIDNYVDSPSNQIKFNYCIEVLCDDPDYFDIYKRIINFIKETRLTTMELELMGVID